MAALVRIRVPDPQDVLDTYGAGALTRLERGTSAAMSDASEVTTVAVVAGTTLHEYRDETGIPGTHWYRSRYSIASPSVSADYSGYGAVFQAGAPSGEILSLEGYKTWAGISDTDDDAWHVLAIGAINRAMLRRITVDIGPSPDTTRTFDGCDATRGGTRLWVPGGIRAFSTVEVRSDSSSSWEAVTSDVRLGPPAWERQPGHPASYLEFIDHPTGSRYRFPDSQSSVRVTGTAFLSFGFDAYPDDLTQAGHVAVQRMSKERGGRGGDWPNETDATVYLRRETFDAYRRIFGRG